MNSFLIGKDFVNIRWEKEIELKKDGLEVGGDQGKLTVLSLSDKQETPKTDKHGHSLDSILEKMSKRRKGTKAFSKCKDHRKNFIHWSINQMNLDGIKHVKLEEVVNIGYGKSRSRLMSHWTNTIIRDKVSSRCEENGVRFSMQSCTYRSQRCSQCGMVRKSNRKGKLYICDCGYSNDADYNASCNHEQSLPEVPLKLRMLNLNRKGFYWKENGFFDLAGVEIRVPLSPTNK
jgi:transposase